VTTEIARTITGSKEKSLLKRGIADTTDRIGSSICLLQNLTTEIARTITGSKEKLLLKRGISDTTDRIRSDRQSVYYEI